MLFEDMGGYDDIENPRDIPVWKIPFLKLNLPLSFLFSLHVGFLYSLFSAHVRSCGWKLKPLAWGLGQGSVTDFSSLLSAFSSSHNVAHLMNKTGFS